MAIQANIVWTITAALLVFFMHAGFGFYEAGMCRKKNTVDTLSHNLLILTVTIIIFWAVGIALFYGEGSELIGYTGFFPDFTGSTNAYPELLLYPVPLVVAFAFTISYADTPATLIAGTGAERIQFSAVMILTILISGFLFPVVAHWIIGDGWLSELDVPVYDTGSGFVHLVGGCCALAVALLLGPRKDSKVEEEDKSKEDDEDEQAIQVSSMPLVFLGAFILWLGFFGFNAGFAMHTSKSVGLVVVNTALAGATGTVAAMIGVQLYSGKARLRTTIVGLLTANVAITSPAAVVEPWAAAIIGGIAGLITIGSIPLMHYLSIDDPTEYLTMNVIGGIFGLICVGLFASPAILSQYSVKLPNPGLFYNGDFSQLLTQLLAAAAIIGFVLPVVLLACAGLRSLGLLRVHPKEEEEGSDRATHGEQAYEDS